MSNIDLNLSVLCIVAKPGTVLTQAAIAEHCGCSRAYIDIVEKTAIKKLQIMVNTHPLKDWGEDFPMKKKRKISIAKYAEIEGVNKWALASAVRRNPDLTIEQCAKLVRDNRK